MEIKRGEIVLADLEPIRGSEQGGIRPCLVIQNNLGNLYSSTTIIAPITSKIFSKEFSTNVLLSKKDSGLEKESTIMLNQIKTIDKSRIIKIISTLDMEIMNRIDLAIKISLGLYPNL
ncbi:MAG: type II toxin-antitoxin system PemK/MazF family toxin [Nanoarchaeota archaeon]